MNLDSIATKQRNAVSDEKKWRKRDPRNKVKEKKSKKLDEEEDQNEKDTPLEWHTYMPTTCTRVRSVIVLWHG